MALSADHRANIQGIILRGYTHPYSCHLLFSFDAPGKTPAFFKALYPVVTSSQEWGDTKPQQLLNIALTFAGIQALGVLEPADAEDFPAEFKEGPKAESLGDVGTSAPESWWNGQFKTSDIHCVVHVYALSTEALAQQAAAVTATASQFGVRELLPLKSGSGRIKGCLDPDGVVHFGYRDGITNPSLDDDPSSNKPDALSSFLIGYASNSSSQPGPTQGKALDFARDGSYVAFRVIQQDVAGFEHFLTQQAELVHQRLGLSLEDAREWIAAKMLGRWRNGSPLVSSPDRPEESTRNAVTINYAEQGESLPGTQTGFRCPFSAHIRVANPRDQQLQSTQHEPPRLLRRGMPYGPPLTSRSDDGEERGLVGLFLCGSLARQFGVIMGWINQNTFSDVFQPGFDRQDGVLGNRDMGLSIVNTYTIPMPDTGTPGSGEPIQLQGLPQFTTTRGTAYTFLPSMASLRKLAGLDS